MPDLAHHPELNLPSVLAVWKPCDQLWPVGYEQILSSPPHFSSSVLLLAWQWHPCTWRGSRPSRSPLTSHLLLLFTITTITYFGASGSQVNTVEGEVCPTNSHFGVLPHVAGYPRRGDLRDEAPRDRPCSLISRCEELDASSCLQ